MDENVYEQLIPVLNSRSTFLLPAVKCPEFFALISYLFTPEEAEIAVAMPYGFASVEEIAASVPGSNAKKIGVQLEAMADKGLIHSKDEKGTTVYELLPLFPGIMELQFYKVGDTEHLKKIDQLFNDYRKNLRTMAKSGTPPKIETEVPGRKIEVGKKVLNEATILPYKEMKELIERTEYIAAGICHCRHSGEYMGNPCSKPMDNCMIFGTSAKFTTERGFTKRLTREQALKKLDEAEEAGLVHQYSNSPDHYANILCNCCSCHCMILRGMTKSPAPNQLVQTRYLIRIDDDNCIGCGACVDRCQIAALKMEGDKLILDEMRCLGCGLCMYVCPTDALILEPKPAGTVPLRIP